MNEKEMAEKMRSSTREGKKEEEEEEKQRKTEKKDISMAESISETQDRSKSSCRTCVLSNCPAFQQLTEIVDIFHIYEPLVVCEVRSGELLGE